VPPALASTTFSANAIADHSHCDDVSAAASSGTTSSSAQQAVIVAGRSQQAQLGGPGQHQHDVGLATASLASTGLAAEGESAKGSQEGLTKEAGSHDEHASLDLTGKAATEFVKKWCTTTPWAKQLVASLDGKPTCKCDVEDSAVAFGASTAEVGAKGRVDVNSTGAASANCRPCEKDAFFAAHSQVAMGDLLSLLLDEAVACEAMSQRDAVASAASVPPASVRSDADDSADEWRSSMQWVGWSLLAVSAVLAPAALATRRTDDDLDALCKGPFCGPLGVERLATA
jgi:hypothetical protein